MRLQAESSGGFHVASVVVHEEDPARRDTEVVHRVLEGAGVGLSKADLVGQVAALEALLDRRSGPEPVPVQLVVVAETGAQEAPSQGFQQLQGAGQQAAVDLGELVQHALHVDRQPELGDEPRGEVPRAAETDVDPGQPVRLLPVVELFFWRHPRAEPTQEAPPATDVPQHAAQVEQDDVEARVAHWRTAPSTTSSRNAAAISARV